MSKNSEFDAIVVGSGISGGWAAKELTEGGLTVLMIERGRNVERGKDYVTEGKNPWELPFRGFGDQKEFAKDYPVQSRGPMNEYNQHFWVKDSESPYGMDDDKPFNWFRGYQLGGRSLTWGRQSLRRSPQDFEANKKDGHGVDWPIRYEDIAPWYDYVEEFIGVSGRAEGAEQIPDGRFQPAMPLNCVEEHLKKSLVENFPGRVMTVGRTANLTQALPGRSPCLFRHNCSRGCSWGGYFSTQSSTLPAAQATGRLTTMTGQRVIRINYDEATKRASGVVVKDENTGDEKTVSSKIVFLCSSTFNTLQLLLNSKSAVFPNGLANTSGVLGKSIMDHTFAAGAMGMVPGFEDKKTSGRRPTYSIIFPFRNTAIDETKVPFLRSYMLAINAVQTGWDRGAIMPGVGASFKDDLSKPGPWMASIFMVGEVLPDKRNFVELDYNNLDPLGQPQLKINFQYRENEKLMAKDAAEQCSELLLASGGHKTGGSDQLLTPGSSIHEMGGAPMGRDPSTSILNAYNQCHDVQNVFITDGAAMSSSSSQNPSLTYMALTARAAKYAVEMVKGGKI